MISLFSLVAKINNHFEQTGNSLFVFELSQKDFILLSADIQVKKEALKEIRLSTTGAPGIDPSSMPDLSLQDLQLLVDRLTMHNTKIVIR